MTDESIANPVEKPIPLWVAAGVLAGIVIGGGALIYTFLYRPRAPNAVNIVTPPPGRPRVARSGDTAATVPVLNPLAAAREAELADGVHRLPGGGTLIKAGDAYVKVFDGPAGARPALSFGFFTVTDAQWEHGYLSNGVRRLLGDGEYASELGVTPEQIKRLEDLPAEPVMGWGGEDRERFARLHGRWHSASPAGRPAIGRELVGALAVYAQSRRAAEERAMDRRVGVMRSVLTPAQVGAMNPIPRWNLPTTRGGGR